MIDVDDREAVATAIAKNPDTAIVRHWLVADLDDDYMDYWELMEALRWGDVCIAIESEWAGFYDEDEDTRLYYRMVEEDGHELLERAPPDEHGRATMPHSHFGATLAHHLDRAVLMTVEGTPFEA